MYVFNYRMWILQAISLFILILFSSCSQRGDIIRNTSLIEIYFKYGDRVYKHQDSSRTLVQDFVKVLNGKMKRKICPTEGEIRFYSKDALLFEAGFSINGGTNKCQFLT